MAELIDIKARIQNESHKVGMVIFLDQLCTDHPVGSKSTILQFLRGECQACYL